MRPVAHLVIAAVFVVALAACASTDAAYEAPETRDTGNELSDDRFALVENVFLATPSRLDLSVLHGSCDDLVPSLTETADRVEIAVKNPVGPEGDCTDEGRITIVEVDLAAALGDRRLVIEVPPSFLNRSGQDSVTCFFGPGQRWCREVIVRSNGAERTIGAPDYPPARRAHIADHR